MDGLVKKVDRSAEIFLERKYEIAKGLQDRKHICGVIGDGLSMIMGTVFINHTDYGKGVQEAQWATAQRTLHGLNESFDDNRGRHELSKLAEQAPKHAKMARLRELDTFKVYVETIVKLKGLDVDTIQQSYTE